MIICYKGYNIIFLRFTLCEYFGRFDIEGDDETQVNFEQNTQIPTTLVPSPPSQVDPREGKEDEFGLISYKQLNLT